MLTLVLLGGTLFLAVTMVLAWLVYTVATLRSEAAYISEVNKVIDHVNALTHNVQQAHFRTTTRIDRADSLAASANEKGVEIDARVDGLLDRINSQASRARRAGEKIDEVEAAAGAAGSNTEANTGLIGQHDGRLVDIESKLTGLVSDDELNQRLANYVQSGDVPEADLSGYARLSDLEDGLSTRSMRSGALELTDGDAGRAASLTYNGDELQLVTGVGQAPTSIGANSLRFGANSLRVSPEGDLEYCKQGRPCQAIA